MSKQKEEAAKAVVEAAAKLIQALNSYPGLLEVTTRCVDAHTIEGSIRRVFDFKIKEETITEIYP